MTIILCIIFCAFGFVLGVVATYTFAVHEANRRRREANREVAREKMREDKAGDDTSE